MVNDVDLERDLAATNPIPEASAASVLPPDVNELVVRQIIDSNRGMWPLRGRNAARIGFVGVLGSIGLVLLGLHLQSGGTITEVTPAAEASPAEEAPVTTTTVLTVGPETTLAAPTDSITSTSTTTSTAAPTKNVSTPTVADTAPPEDRGPTPAGEEGSDTATGVEGSGDALGNGDTEAPAVPPADTADAGDAPDPEAADDEADDEPGDEADACTATGRTRADAIDAYQQACSAPRVDCDPIDGVWICSSEQIGESSPKNP